MSLKSAVITHPTRYGQWIGASSDGSGNLVI